MNSHFLHLHVLITENKIPVLININNITEIYPVVNNDDINKTVIWLNTSVYNEEQISVKVLEQFEDIIALLPVLPPITTN